MKYGHGDVGFGDMSAISFFLGNDGPLCGKSDIFLNFRLEYILLKRSRHESGLQPNSRKIDVIYLLFFLDFFFIYIHILLNMGSWVQVPN